MLKPVLCSGRQYSKMVFESFSITTRPPNNCEFLEDGNTIIVKKFVLSHEFGQVVVGKQFLAIDGVYHKLV